MQSGNFDIPEKAPPKPAYEQRRSPSDPKPIARPDLTRSLEKNVDEKGYFIPQNYTKDEARKVSKAAIEARGSIDVASRPAHITGVQTPLFDNGDRN